MGRQITTKELAARLDRIADTQETMLLSLGETRTIVSAIDARCKERSKYCDEMRHIMQGELAEARSAKDGGSLVSWSWGKNKYVKISAALAGAGGLGVALAKWISTIVR